MGKLTIEVRADPVAGVVKVVSIPLARASLCVNCEPERVVEAVNNHCPICNGTGGLLNLGQALNRESVPFFVARCRVLRHNKKLKLGKTNNRRTR